LSNYSQIIFYTPKDSLALGNPSKVIYGANIDGELAAISTAIISKWDSNTTTISSSISWVGQQTFQGLNNAYAVKIYGTGNAGESFGLQVLGGMNSSDVSLLVQNFDSVNQFQVTGAGAIQGYGPTAAAWVDMTPDKGTFTGTITGCTTTPTQTFNWVRTGNLVMVTLSVGLSLTATSNSTGCTITGLPAAIQPATTETVVVVSQLEDNSTTSLLGTVLIQPTSGVITLAKYTSGAFSTTGFTGSGTKGVTAGFSFSYMLA
jgi:hypothetical protein